MSKIREILEKYARDFSSSGSAKGDAYMYWTKYINEDVFDKLEKDLSEHVILEISNYYTSLGYELQGKKWVRYMSKEKS